MIEISLANNKGTILIDNEDSYVIMFPWHRRKGKNTFYAGSSIYDKSTGTKKTIYLHRLIMRAPDHAQVDHINGNGLDNRRSNLRLVTQQENNFNRRKVCGISKYKGVTWKKSHNKWQARIKINRKNIHLGYFESEIEAALAYDYAIQQKVGKIACTNQMLYPEDFS